MHTATATARRVFRRLTRIVRYLETEFDRKFTIDGHLLGSLGEILAAEVYGLTLLPTNAKDHDATAPDGRRVQVKATQGDRIAISSEPDFLIVLRLDREGNHQEVYNGPGAGPWAASRPGARGGQRFLGLGKLRMLHAAVRNEDRIRGG